MVNFSFKKNNILLCLEIASLFFSFSTINKAQSATNNSFLSSGNRLKFGNYLFSEKDYLRAMNEYREYLKTADNDTVRFKFAECFFRIGRYDEAMENFKGLFYYSDISEEAQLGFYRSIFFKNDFTQLRDDIITEVYLPEKYSNQIKRLGLISHFFDNSILPDSNIFFNAFPDSNVSDIKRFYRLKKYPSKKDPTKAGLLSAIIPGAGKIYTGDIGDGITAFIATGLLTYLSINNFNHDHNFRGWLFGGLAAFSYAGNIYGSAASAQIYNAGVKFNFDNEVKLYFEKRNYLLPKEEF